METLGANRNNIAKTVSIHQILQQLLEERNKKSKWNHRSVNFWSKFRKVKCKEIIVIEHLLTNFENLCSKFPSSVFHSKITFMIELKTTLKSFLDELRDKALLLNGSSSYIYSMIQVYNFARLKSNQNLVVFQFVTDERMFVRYI